MNFSGYIKEGGKENSEGSTFFNWSHTDIAGSPTGIIVCYFYIVLCYPEREQRVAKCNDAVLNETKGLLQTLELHMF